MLKPIEGAVLLGALMLYLVPAMIADARDREDAFAVTMVNILLGWTVIGWFAALIWARQVMTVLRLVAYPAEGADACHARGCAGTGLSGIWAPQPRPSRLHSRCAALPPVLAMVKKPTAETKETQPYDRCSRTPRAASGRDQGDGGKPGDRPGDHRGARSR